MTAQTCATGCDRPTRDTLLLCEQCRGELEKCLSEMPALLDELQTTLTRQTKGGSESGGKATKGKTQPLPFDVRASDVLSELTVFLHGWTRVLVEDHQQQPPMDTLRAMSRFLLWRLDMIAGHEAAGDIHREITSACGHGWRAVDRAPNRFFIGVCDCGEWLYAKLGAALTTCRGCEKSYDVESSRDALWAALDGTLMTISEIIGWGQQLKYVEERDVKRVRNLLDQWVKRGRIVAHQVNHHGKGMYPFGETLTKAMAALKERVA